MATHPVVHCERRASEIVDQDGFCEVTQKLVETIVRAVTAGKSLRAVNKDCILECCEELSEAIKILPTIRDPTHYNEGVVRELSFQISSGMDSMYSLHNEAIGEVQAKNAEIEEKVSQIAQQGERLEDLVRLSGNMLSAALKETHEKPPNPEPPIATLTDVTQKLKDEIRTIVRDEISSLTKDLKTAPIVAPTLIPEIPPTSVTYASVTSKKPPPTPVTKPAIIVSAFDITKPPLQIVNDWKKAISFRKVKYAPTKIQTIPNGKLRVEFERPEQCEETIARTLTADGFHAEKAKRRPPLIVLKGVPKDVTRDELLDVLHTQNDAKVVRICFLTSNRNPLLYNAVLEVSPEMRKVILALGKLNVDHSRVHVEDFSRFVQCFNCLSYGHTKAKCTSEKRPCSYCGSEGHQFKECPNKADPTKKSCYNCAKYHQRMNTKGNVAHNATDPKECPRIKAMLDRLLNQTDFGS